MRAIAIQPDQHLSPDISIVGAFGGSALLPIVVLFFVLSRRRKLKAQGRRADASCDGSAILAPGPAVLYGRVEHAHGALRAVRIEIDQLGTEGKPKGDWHHRWRETARRVEANAFYLRTDAGRRLRVEPTEALSLVDEMDMTSPQYRTQAGICRSRAAELTLGERVFAVGELVMAHDPEGASHHHGGARSLVLRKPSAGPMLLSSKPLSEAFVRRASVLRLWTWVFILTMAGFQAFLVPYYASLFFGKTEQGEVVSKRIRRTTDSRGRTTGHWVVRIKLPGGDEFEDQIAPRDSKRLDSDSTVLVRTVAGWPSMNRVGSQATIHLAHLVFSLVGFPLLALGIWLHLLSARPWYEREFNEGGPGRLPPD